MKIIILNFKIKYAKNQISNFLVFIMFYEKYCHIIRGISYFYLDICLKTIKRMKRNIILNEKKIILNFEIKYANKLN